MSIREMVSFYQYFEVFLTPQPRHYVVAAKAVDGDDPSGYPAIVYDVNGNNIGTANTKQEFLDIWNANPANKAVGKLTGWYGPFAFEFIALNAIGLKSDSQSEMDFVIDSDSQIITDSDEVYITN